ncbi:Hsp20/alpha crystallin family protein [Aeromicrobium camelliae]|uniref:Hsp20/alpha crystallin family protein n=1 Tax=Aeromicrobium camelliae TaxID=1538144 RepID=A0A3N6WN52_9ACTN|nr:Hsp20/alpha crystallin family protein [Aeromicrobium camelliae]RQN03058.1 Hsp20/alpha crystallin family protein [Aeromicrobium camelliae]
MSTTLSLFTRRDPFDALMRSAFGTGTWPEPLRTDFMPAAEAVRDGDDVIVRLEVPGIDIESDVTVEVVQDRLVVRGERRDERAEDREGRSIREIRYGQFERTFTLPSHIGADAVSASYDRGVLNIRVSGVYAGTEPTRITISEGSTTKALTADEDDATER